MGNMSIEFLFFIVGVIVSARFVVRVSATWIMLKGPDGKVHPVYMEPEIIVSPFPLHAMNVGKAET